MGQAAPVHRMVAPLGVTLSEAQRAGHVTWSPLTRRGFFAVALSGLVLPAHASAAPKLVVGRQQTRNQPSGSLSSDQAWSLAQHIVALHLRHEARLSAFDVFLIRVAETGSMRPALGDGDVVIMEMAPYGALGLGDIVWWINESQMCWGLEGHRGPQSVLHRITGGAPGGWITRGDNNVEADPGRVTQPRYRARACQVIHCLKERG